MYMKIFFYLNFKYFYNYNNEIGQMVANINNKKKRKKLLSKYFQTE